MRPEITFRDETPQDDPFLHALYATTRDLEMNVVPWDDAQKQTFLAQQSHAQLTHYRAHYSDASFQIILIKNAPAGRVYVHRGPKEFRLMDISLLREFRNKGIGTTLMKELMAEAAAAGKNITLHVERFNPALHLYERLGFRAIEDKGIYLYMEWKPSA